MARQSVPQGIAALRYDPLLMTRTLRSQLTQRRFAWLLWLALLLPIAQLAAGVHILSHAHGDHSGKEPVSQAIHEDLCGLCPSAAAVLGGGPVVASSAPVLPAALYAAPLAALPVMLQAALAHAYDSRAPPLSTH